LNDDFLYKCATPVRTPARKIHSAGRATMLNSITNAGAQFKRKVNEIVNGNKVN